MEIEFDPKKREATLKERGLDFRDADKVFSGRTATLADTRVNYGEDRFITAGFLNERLVVVVWTERGASRRIISMRYAHAKEITHWESHMG